jgi:DNA-binding transcriptional MerR regulator
MSNSSLTREKSADAYRTISEVADALKLPQHVLRFWETRFTQIRPLKRGGGRRYYRPEDIELLGAIRQLLYGEGYTIKGVQRILRENGPRAVAALARTGADAMTSGPNHSSRQTVERIVMASMEDGGPAPYAEHEGSGLGRGPGGAASESREQLGLQFLQVASAGESGSGAESVAVTDPVAQLRDVLASLDDCRRILQAARP